MAVLRSQAKPTRDLIRGVRLEDRWEPHQGMGAVMADQKKDLTEYVVLRQTAPEGPWVELGTVKAASQAVAKKAGLAEWAPTGGVVVAVPARSWEPEDLKPKLSFG